MTKVPVFVSFDVQHDEDLYELLLAQSKSADSSFEVLDGSRRATQTNLESVRGRIREADQVIVICGERTDASTCVSAELELAQQEGTPYVLLWGRRDLMCTKPNGTKPAEGMYSWTRRILQDQIVATARKVAANAAATAARDARRKH